jgi:putative FmdB family regulatory protein
VQFDQQQKFTDGHLTKCPECGKRTLLKVFMPVGVVFKGSGFYATDNRSPSGMTSTPSEEKSKVEKPAEVKPADKVETPKSEVKPKKE